MVEQEAVNFEVVSSSLTGGAIMKIQTLKVCFLFLQKYYSGLDNIFVLEWKWS